MSSGATCSAGRAKKDWGRCWERVVAMGVAIGVGAIESGLGYERRETIFHSTPNSNKSQSQLIQFRRQVTFVYGKARIPDSSKIWDAIFAA